MKRLTSDARGRPRSDSGHGLTPAEWAGLGGRTPDPDGPFVVVGRLGHPALFVVAAAAVAAMVTLSIVTGQYGSAGLVAAGAVVFFGGLFRIRRGRVLRVTRDGLWFTSGNGEHRYGWDRVGAVRQVGPDRAGRACGRVEVQVYSRPGDQASARTVVIPDWYTRKCDPAILTAMIELHRTRAAG